MEDLSLVSRCISGDKQAWDDFLTRYARLIYRFIHSSLKIKSSQNFSPDVINELFHEIIVSLAKDNCRKLRSFKGKNGCSFASWLRQVTVHFTIDFLRKQNKTISLEEKNDFGIALKDTLADVSGKTVERAEFQEHLIHLKECVGALDLNEKYFLELHFVQELSLDSLKDHFMISRGSVDMRKLRIVEKLRDCFKNKGVFVGIDSMEQVK